MDSNVSEIVCEVSNDASEAAGIIELNDLQLVSIGGGIADIIGV